MSGHSKWSTIKHQKAVEDSKRGAVFTKIAKKIQVAVKKGGSGDLANNSFLRSCVEEARSVNMPMENIKRAVDKGLGTGGENTAEEIVYEAYSREGVGLLITTITDSRNRTTAEINSILNKHDAKLGSPGSVSYMKSITPIPTVKLSTADESKTLALIESLAGLDDVVDVWSSLE